MNRQLNRKALRSAVFFLLLAGLVVGACSRPEIGYPRFVRDLYVSMTIQEGIRSLSNQHLSGQPYGAVAVAGACEGGSISIDGTIEQDANYDRMNLIYTLTDCQMSVAMPGLTVDLVVSGSVQLTSSFDNLSGIGNESLIAEDLKIEGDSTYSGHDVHMNNTCDWEFTLVVTDISESFMGELCGKPITLSMSHTG